jgi:pyrroline-5-carboxylate reductase
VVKFGMIGGGVMGEALLSRLVAQKLYAPLEMLVSEPQLQRRDFLAQHYGVQVTAENSEVAGATEVIFLAIKPQVLATVVAALPITAPTALIISILAGTPLTQLEAAFPDRAVVRAMPNTPAAIGAGITAIAAGQHAHAHHLDQARQILQTVGEVLEVPEASLDAVTGLSGSGPGYVAVIIEALADGGVAAGLSRAVALQLALQTVRGTAQLLQETGLHPAELKDRVTSPGGTTIAGIAQLERAGVRSALIEAVRIACQRSQELGEKG